MRSPRRAALIGSLLAAAALSFFGILVFFQPASAHGGTTAPTRAGTSDHTLSVGGHGEIDMAPDEATITLGVETRGSEARDALSSNATKMNAVISALQSQGVPSNRIQTSNLGLWRDSEHGTYVSNHQLTVRLDNVQRVGAVLDAAVDAGANSAWGVSFGLKDQSAARAKALQAAIQDARSRADALAGALGVPVSGVQSVSEANYSYHPPVQYAVAPVPGAPPAPTTVQTGELTVSADVSVVYTFG